ncbi:hypothetical protein [Tenacibaculum amylolyticum]|uniref:hypothetical protein n=1 Tax=Tenacibaculum amylolyticum TaxID=104269 RepID=UPI0038940E6C
MKYTTFFLCVLLTTSAYCQVTTSISSFSGYERNIYKVPNSLLSEGTVLGENDLYASSIYQDILAKLTYEKIWKHSSLKFYVTPEMRYYFSEQNARRVLLNSRVKYTYNFNRNTKWENTFSFKKKDQKGQDLDANELSTPLGYDRLNLSSALIFRLSKRNRTSLAVHYGNKSFDASESRQISYTIYGADITWKQVQWKNHLLYAYGFNAGFSSRAYDIFDIEEEITNKRTWNYWNAEVFYKLPVHKKLAIQPSIGYEKRMDETNNQFGYDELNAAVKVKYKGERFNFSMYPSYGYRVFDELNIPGTSSQKLRYHYIRANMNMEYRLNKKFLLLSRAYLIDRNSNNNDITTTAYRSYNNNYIGLGLRFIF